MERGGQAVPRICVRLRRLARKQVSRKVWRRLLRFAQKLRRERKYQNVLIEWRKADNTDNLSMAADALLTRSRLRAGLIGGRGTGGRHAAGLREQCVRATRTIGP